jgi:uncharacterized membrane protein YcjF (UPF0283 family)
MVTKRQLGIALVLVSLAIAVGAVAVDWVGAGEWSGFGPLQWLGLGAGAVLLLVSVGLILRGNRPA